MNLPNKLTILRMLLIPAFLLFYFWESLPWNYLWALLVFGAASLTDMLDGRIARKRGLVTDFGKFMDPLADKILVMAAMVCFVETGITPGVVVIVVLARELAITSLRTIAAGAGVILAADRWGKLKTATQMVWICYTLLYLWVQNTMGLSLTMEHIMDGIFYGGMALVLVFTLFSGVNYLWKNRGLLADR